MKPPEKPTERSPLFAFLWFAGWIAFMGGVAWAADLVLNTAIPAIN